MHNASVMRGQEINVRALPDEGREGGSDKNLNEGTNLWTHAQLFVVPIAKTEIREPLIRYFSVFFSQKQQGPTTT